LQFGAEKTQRCEILSFTYRISFLVKQSEKYKKRLKINDILAAIDTISIYKKIDIDTIPIISISAIYQQYFDISTQPYKKPQTYTNIKQKVALRAFT